MQLFDNNILESEWSTECIDFIIMSFYCVLYYLFDKKIMK